MQKYYDYAKNDLFNVEFILKNRNKLKSLSSFVSSCLMNTDSKELIIDFSTYGIKQNDNGLIIVVKNYEDDLNKFEYQLISVKDIIIQELDRSGGNIMSYHFKNKTNLIRLNTTKYYIAFELTD